MGMRNVIAPMITISQFPNLLVKNWELMNVKFLALRVTLFDAIPVNNQKSM